MMREWATVVAWQNGIATLSCNQSSACSSCSASSACGFQILNKMKRSNVIEFDLPIEQPLKEGQRVEIGINDVNVLHSAFWIYFIPLLGLLIGATLANWLVGGNLIVMLGALVGGVVSFIFARNYVRRLEQQRFYQPVVLQIALPSKTE